MWLLGRTRQAYIHTYNACNNRKGRRTLYPSQPNTAHRVSESFFALSMSVTLNGYSTVHSASAEFQTNSVIHPSQPINHQVFSFSTFQTIQITISIYHTNKNQNILLYIPSLYHLVLLSLISFYQGLLFGFMVWEYPF